MSRESMLILVQNFSIVALSGCSIAVFTIELIHHGWIPFLFSVSSIVARLQLRTTWLDMVCNLGFWRCIQIEFHYIRIKCLWCGMEAPRVRKGKSSDEEEQMKRTDEEEQMKRNRFGDAFTHFLVPRTKELVFIFNRTLHLEVNTVMVEHKCPKGDSWNEARCKQIELHYTEVKCLWCGTEARKASLF
ncbi:hypothetical protein LOTGIDRAFT_175966 [Lottia gigantea]|uniref:Uncharacterized protein n=1 Tax=Lottia gigantea TaxID=225164 RepID=V3ZXN7_LOTGI|nr:hypothetical protein LOTGIDRAFT_175966 [Lottia gigantea]ESO87355.1 hypothetical protein LOTGIDRAFT_175966 [Lottia gigantea]